MPVTSAQCISGTEKLPDNAILLNYNDDHYSQAYGQIKEDSKAHTKVRFSLIFIFFHNTIFSFIVNSVFFNNASLYLSVKLSIF